MKQILLTVLTAVLLLTAGCSDNKQTEAVAPEEPSPAGSLTKQAESITKDLTQKAEDAAEQAAEKLNEATKKLNEATEKAQSIIENFTVSKEQVLAEINEPIANLKAKVETLAQPELLAYANAYKELLLENKNHLTSLAEQLKGLPMGDMLGEKGKAIKDQISQYTAQLGQLKERYSIYLDKLKMLGVDLSAFGI